jgi:hypothetical protein
MESILANLHDPSWYFTAVVPALLFALAPHAWRRSAQALRRFTRSHRRNKLMQIRSLRRDDVLVAHQLQRVNTSFVVFMLFGVTGLMLMALTPFKGNETLRWIFAAMATAPVLVAEGFWLYRDQWVCELLKYRARRKGVSYVNSTKFI